MDIVSTGARNLRSTRIMDSIDLARSISVNPAEDAELLAKSLVKVEAPEVRKAAEAVKKYNQYDALIEGEKNLQTKRFSAGINEGVEPIEEEIPVNQQIPTEENDSVITEENTPIIPPTQTEATLEEIWNLVYNLGLQLAGINTRLDAVESRLKYE